MTETHKQIIILTDGNTEAIMAEGHLGINMLDIDDVYYFSIQSDENPDGFNVANLSKPKIGEQMQTDHIGLKQYYCLASEPTSKPLFWMYTKISDTAKNQFMNTVALKKTQHKDSPILITKLWE